MYVALLYLLCCLRKCGVLLTSLIAKVHEHVGKQEGKSSRQSHHGKEGRCKHCRAFVVICPSLAVCKQHLTHLQRRMDLQFSIWMRAFYCRVEKRREGGMWRLCDDTMYHDYEWLPTQVSSVSIMDSAAIPAANESVQELFTSRRWHWLEILMQCQMQVAAQLE